MIMAGIYVGEDLVIHFTSTEIKDSKQKHPCAKCGYQHNVDVGVIKTCLVCFLSKNALSSNSLCLYQYDESRFAKKLKRSGTCSTFKCLPPETVVQTANELHKENSFGPYNLVENNCEDFATFCKTGIRRSEQAAMVMNIPMIDPLLNLVKNLKLSAS
ncbi:hypothetical protein CRYUN_Cryun16bG0022400 [Craigia yunnanensis]